MRTLEARIKQGYEAIAKAKALGTDTTEWELHLSNLERVFEDANILGVHKYNLLREVMRGLETRLPSDFYLLLEKNEKANNAYLELEKRVHKACWSRYVGVEEFKTVLDEVWEFHIKALEWIKPN